MFLFCLCKSLFGILPVDCRVLVGILLVVCRVIVRILPVVPSVRLEFPKKFSKAVSPVFQSLIGNILLKHMLGTLQNLVDCYLC